MTHKTWFSCVNIFWQNKILCKLQFIFTVNNVTRDLLSQGITWLVDKLRKSLPYHLHATYHVDRIYVATHRSSCHWLTFVEKVPRQLLKSSVVVLASQERSVTKIEAKKTKNKVCYLITKSTESWGKMHSFLSRNYISFAWPYSRAFRNVPY